MQYDKALCAIKLLTEEEVAERLSVAPHTMKRLRLSGAGPPHIPIGRKIIRYRVQDVEAWQASKTKGGK
jgi:predicted DNA-binding transcriptional regulator AlpA